MDQYISEGRASRTYAQPLSGLQVSWGSVLAGAVAICAVSLILFALALAVILTATNVNLGSIKASALAIWICAIVTTLIGAVVGGFIAGYLPGNPRRSLGAAHGFLAWGVALLFAAAFDFATIGGIARNVTNAAVTTATTAVQTAGSTIGNVAGGVAGSNVSIESKAMSFLVSLGYTPEEAARMVASAQADVQKVLRGGAPGPESTQATSQQVRGALDTLVDWSAGVTWSWFGTWLVAGLLAIAGGAIATKRVRDREARAPLGAGAPTTTAPYETATPTPGSV